MQSTIFWLANLKVQILKLLYIGLCEESKDTFHVQNSFSLAVHCNFNWHDRQVKQIRKGLHCVYSQAIYYFFLSCNSCSNIIRGTIVLSSLPLKGLAFCQTKKLPCYALGKVKIFQVGQWGDFKNYTGNFSLKM